MHATYWGPGLQHRHVPWLGIEQVTLCFAGWHSAHWATPARADDFLWFGYVPRSGSDGSSDSFLFNFWKNPPTVFHRDHTVYIPINSGNGECREMGGEGWQDKLSKSLKGCSTKTVINTENARQVKLWSISDKRLCHRCGLSSHLPVVCKGSLFSTSSPTLALSSLIVAILTVVRWYLIVVLIFISWWLVLLSSFSCPCMSSLEKCSLPIFKSDYLFFVIGLYDFLIYRILQK